MRRLAAQPLLPACRQAGLCGFVARTCAIDLTTIARPAQARRGGACATFQQR